MYAQTREGFMKLISWDACGSELTRRRMSEETPRVNASCLEDFKGRTIRILGKVKSLHGESCVIDANGDVTVYLARVSSRLYDDKDGG